MILPTVECAGGLILSPMELSNGQLAVLLAKQTFGDRTEYGLPKGHIEDGESALEAALREIGEETPLWPGNLSMISELGFIRRTSHERDGTLVEKTIQMFLGWCPPFCDGWESASWFSVDDAIAALHFEKDKVFLQKHLSLMLRSDG